MKNVKLRQLENGLVDGNDNEMLQEFFDRFQGVVSFGYGIFQICIFMVFFKILKLIELFGFEGDRDVGLVVLDYFSYSKDMKVFFVILGLLWYYIILRLFFVLDGVNDYSVGKCESY